MYQIGPEMGLSDTVDWILCIGSANKLQLKIDDR